MKKRVVTLLGLAALVFVVVPPASADQILYYTNIGAGASEPGSIQKLDVTTGINTPVITGLLAPDSMLFSTPTTIVFTQTNSGAKTGAVNQVNIDGTGLMNIAGGFSFPEDLALDPGGQSVVVSDTNDKTVVRINLLTHTVTTLATFSAPVRGITYDATGRLFVNVDSGSPQIVELDPLTGAVLKTLTLPVGGDGLTFDPSSGHLWAVVLNNSAIFRIADDLSSFTEVFCPDLSDANLCGNYDGLQADGSGNVDIANNIGYVDQFNIAAGTFSVLAPAPNIDDLAPIVGLGSPGSGGAPTPEPTSAVLVLTGVLALFLVGCKRSRVTLLPARSHRALLKPPADR